MSERLAYLGAREARDRFLAGRLRPSELLESLLARAAALHGGEINATAAIHADEARARAREADARYAAGRARPLEGVPVAIKEETAVAGWPRTIGSYLHDERPERNHPIVDKLLAAGAVPHLQTTVPEFCLIGQTHSARYGVTRNPWNPAVTCGGSSGGSGAALAAGLAPLATGSDMGGSIRIPAALCGVYGYKPPFGRLAPTPGEELFSFAVEGPMARSLEDLVLMQNVIAGPHPASYVGMPFKPLPFNHAPLDGARFALALDTGSPALCAATRAHLERAADALRSRGALVDEVSLGWDGARIGDALIEAIFGIFFAEYLDALDSAALARGTTYLRWLVGRYGGRRNSILKAAALASDLHAQLEREVWGRGYRALLCPTVFTTELSADFDLVAERTIAIGGHSVDSYLGWVGTPPFNLLSRCPALAVPLGLATNGVPTSLQIVGPPYRDEVVFAVAWHLAQAEPPELFRTRFPAALEEVA